MYGCQQVGQRQWMGHKTVAGEESFACSKSLPESSIFCCRLKYLTKLYDRL